MRSAESPGNGVVLVISDCTDEIRAGLSSEDVFRFKMFPLIAVRSTHPWATNPPHGARITPVTPTGYHLTWGLNRGLLELSHLARTWAPNGNRWAMGLAAAPEFVIPSKSDPDVLDWIPLVTNTQISHSVACYLSLQLRHGQPLPHDSMLGIATRITARTMPLLVAAGNWGTFGEGTLSPLAMLPWTIAVGATVDADGTRRLIESSVGQRGQPRRNGVAIMAYGENDFVPGTFGTSYAAPRAFAQFAAMTAFLLELKNVDFTRRTGVLQGVPLLASLTVDSGFTDYDPRPSLPLPMIPLMGVDREAAKGVFSVLDRAGCDFRIEAFPQAVKSMVLESARPMPGYHEWEVGAGFVSHETTLTYLTNFNGDDLARLMLPGVHLDDQVRTELRSFALTDQAQLKPLLEVARRSMLRYAIDYRTGEIFASMRDPGISPDETGYHKSPSRYLWPQPLNEEAT